MIHDRGDARTNVMVSIGANDKARTKRASCRGEPTSSQDSLNQPHYSTLLHHLPSPLPPTSAHLKDGKQADVTKADRRLAMLRQGAPGSGNVDLLHQLVQDLQSDHIVVVGRLSNTSQVQGRKGGL